MESFTTHTGEIVTGARLDAAISRVLEEYEQNARAIRVQDDYASHISEAQKDQFLVDDLEFAQSLRDGRRSFSWSFLHRINYELTGECVGLLP